ncbi:MAG TPA: hypothetical protein VFU10_00525 [Gaiellaceae bacterium]|nr:hypothetical protein [Gaiellaceae bacterium]
MTTMHPDAPETPRARAEREAVERALADVHLRGRPLPRRPRLERTTLDRYLRAVGGALPYMRRLRTIELATRVHEEALRQQRDDLARRLAAPQFAEAWRTAANAWDFDEINGLIEKHNRWYPVEAELPMDPRTGDYRLVGGRPYWRRPLDAAWVLERYPAAWKSGC